MTNALVLSEQNYFLETNKTDCCVDQSTLRENWEFWFFRENMW